jgi:hypothetical protein
MYSCKLCSISIQLHIPAILSKRDKTNDELNVLLNVESDSHPSLRKERVINRLIEGRAEYFAECLASFQSHLDIDKSNVKLIV